jgi:tripartite-type tricarboxylate transporter receptor subunit TctC
MRLVAARWLACLVALVLVLAPGGASADPTYPNRPIRLIVPFPPGGSTDVIARILSPRLSDILGQSIVVENKSGAGGVIGFDAAAKAPKDGYTLGMILSGIVITPMLPGGSLPFDPDKDLEPVIFLGSSANVLSVPTAHPAADIRALLAMAKAKPAALTIGHAGNGTVVHLTAELLRRRGGVDLTVVPYKGGGPVIADLAAGHIDMAFNQVTTVLPHVEAGRLRPLALAAATRTPVLPQVETLDEVGIKGIHTSEWYGVVVPSGTPHEIVARLNAAFQAALTDPAVVARCTALAVEIEGGPPDRLRAFLRAEHQKWAAIVKETGAANE